MWSGKSSRVTRFSTRRTGKTMSVRLAELRDLIRDRGRLKAVFKKIFRELSQ